MKMDELRAVQGPLKEKYRAEPGTAMITLRAEGRIGEKVSCSVQTGRALVEAGLHPATGGGGTLAAVAKSTGVELRGGTVRAEGDLDFRGTLGVAKDVPAGFQKIRLDFDVDTDASEEQIGTLQRLTERYCVVYQTLRQGASMSVSVNGHC